MLTRCEILPPVWTYGLLDQQDQASERDTINWGATAISPGAENVHPEAAKDFAVINRCRFYTTLTASSGEDFDVARDSFLGELEDWWARLTSWLGVLTVQDFVVLGQQGETVAAPLRVARGGRRCCPAGMSPRRLVNAALSGMPARRPAWHRPAPSYRAVSGGPSWPGSTPVLLPGGRVRAGSRRMSRPGSSRRECS